MKNTLYTFLLKHKAFIVFLLASLSVRFFKPENYLYFIWDQGRDAWAIHRIVQGDFTLVGPTSGLPGFFLGPLWHYIGIPGYLLFQGNPVGIACWYIFLACLALPLFWYLGKLFFPKHSSYAQLLAYSLAFIPSSIHGMTFIWNPLLSIPLMTAAFISLSKARESRIWLALGFFFLALTLQSEFAYAIFFIVVCGLLIPYIRQKFSFVDYCIAGAAVGITLLPQLLFEIRNKGVMTQSLLKAMADDSMRVSWLELLQHRPQQLISATFELLTGGNSIFTIIAISYLSLILYGLSIIIRKKKTASDVVASNHFLWQLLAIFAVLPYPFFMIWRGNYGNFFSYYLTPHFIFLIPLLILGIYHLVKHHKKTLRYLPYFYLILLSIVAWHTFANKILYPNQKDGMKIMQQAITQAYVWGAEAGQNPPVFRIFTPNRETEHYDYLSYWLAKTKNQPVAKTVYTNEGTLYIIIEPDYAPPEIRFLPWYTPITTGFVMTKQKNFGDLTVEEWQQPSASNAGNLK